MLLQSEDKQVVENMNIVKLFMLYSPLMESQMTL